MQPIKAKLSTTPRETASMQTPSGALRASWLSIYSLIAALALLVQSPTASAEMLTYNYVGAQLTYSPDPTGAHPGQYGPNMLGTLTVDSALVNGFTGTLTSGFTVALGTDSFGYSSTFCVTGGCPPQQSVTFNN